MPDPSNKIAKADIEEVLNRLAVDSTLLVNSNFNILVSCPVDKVTPVTSYIETKLYECGIMPSRTAYNQLELFTDSFPGNAYTFNPDYDLFLTLSDAALCLFFKEHLKGSEDTPLTTYYTDRQGLPVCIDITRLKELAIAQMQAGETVWFGSDVGQSSNRKAGVMVNDMYDFTSSMDIHLTQDKAGRLDYSESLMTHAMVLTGVDLDENGKSTKWKVENSWGDKVGNKGYFVASDDWMDEYTYQIVVRKEFLSPYKNINL